MQMTTYFVILLLFLDYGIMGLWDDSADIKILREAHIFFLFALSG